MVTKGRGDVPPKFLYINNLTCFVYRHLFSIINWFHSGRDDSMEIENDLFLFLIFRNACEMVLNAFRHQNDLFFSKIVQMAVTKKYNDWSMIY